MIEKLAKFFFFLLILSIPIQLGKHFWPSFSFVSGIRVDYLSPTLYLSDIAAVFVIVFFIFSLIRKNSFGFKLDGKFLLVTTLFVLVLVLQFFISKSPLAHLYGVIKFLELLIVGMFAAIGIRQKDFGIIVYCFSIGAFFSSLLAASQLFLQHSVGSIFYFLGERTFSVSTIGIAKMSSYNTQILRPYAAFPHPNVLAFFLLTSIVLTLYYVSYEKNKLGKAFLAGSFLVSSTALLITFSRVTIFCLLAFLLYYVVFNAKRKSAKHFLVKGAISAIIIFFVILFHKRFFAIDTDFFYRLNLTSIALAISTKNFLFGVGLNNFFVQEIAFQKIISPILLQPVHNIYLLSLVQLGLFGALFPAVFVWKTFKRIFRNYKKEKNVQTKSIYESLSILLISALIIGFFDHFFLTVQQGQLILAILFGFCWVKFKRTTPTV